MARFVRETVAAALACAALLLAPAHSLAAGPPQIGAAWVTEVSNTGATMFMELNPNGSTVHYWFEYLPEAAYQANPEGDRFAGASKTPTVTTLASGFLDVSARPSSPLTPGTAYRYRPVATKAVGGSPLEAVGPVHVFVALEFPPPSLPDGRAWEMVSPVDKNGGGIAAPRALFGGGDLQASAAPGGVTYGSATSFGNAAGAPPVSQYVSRRSSSGWSTENVSPPLESAAYGDNPDGAPYRLFSTDLSRGLLFGGLACRGGLEGCPAPNMPLAGSGAPAEYMAYYLRDSATGAFSSLLTGADVSHSSLAPAALEVEFAAAAPDLSHVILSSCAALTADTSEIPGAPGHCDANLPNLYDWSAAGLRAINLQPGATSATPGASIAAPIGAVSEDGSRIYWSDGSELFLREGDSTVKVDEGGGSFQAATPDGAFAFFIKEDKLYRFDAASKTASVVVPAGGVVGVLGVSSDGETAYYQDAGGLRSWHAGAITTVAEGADAALPSDYPPATATARVSADGTRLAFLSKAELTAFDNIDVKTKLPDAELYVYGPPAAGGAPSLVCASCNPTGERPEGPASIPGVLVNGSTAAYRPRVLSADGTTLFFESADRIFTGDSKGSVDVFEWKAQGAGGCASSFGCVGPISGLGAADSTFVDASADATDVFFLTGSSLVEGDPGAVDLYDARIGGGLPGPGKETICVGDSCQGLPGEPEDPTPGTLVGTAGNPPLHIFGPKKKRKLRLKHHHRRHHHRHRGRRRHRPARSEGRAR